MNKKLMKLTIALLVAIIVMVPLMGSAQASKNKEPITLSRKIRTSPGYVDFFGDTRNVGKLYLALPLESNVWDGKLTFADETFIEFDSKTYSYIIANLETLTGQTMTKLTLSNADGGFKGTLLLKTTYVSIVDYTPYGHPGFFSPNPSTATSEYYAVLNGYGAYKGQKIVLLGIGPYSGPYDGFLIA